jgi:hypothetical protein
LIHLLLCEMSRAALGGGAANSRRRPARSGCRAVADPGGSRVGCAVATKGVSSCDRATQTAGTPGAASSRPHSRREFAFLCHLDGVASRPGNSQRSRRAAAATPPASVSVPTATWVASVIGCSSMATPGTCAAQIREPASTIIEGGKAEGSGELPGSERTADEVAFAFQAPAWRPGGGLARCTGPCSANRPGTAAICPAYSARPVVTQRIPSGVTGCAKIRRSVRGTQGCGTPLGGTRNRLFCRPIEPVSGCGQGSSPRWW